MRSFRFLLILASVISILNCTSNLNVVAISTDRQKEKAADYIIKHYEKSEHMLTMRDGVQLFTAIYQPSDRSETYPILLLRTPYSCRPYGADKYKSMLGPSWPIVRDKYIFVYQDVRGKFMSEGTYENMRAIIPDKTSAEQVDESTDTYDTIEWLVNNISNNNGKVGMYGTSYPGFYVTSGLVNAHPALKAATPQCPIADWWFDDFHHHGAFFLAHMYWFMYVFGPERPEPSTEGSARFEFPTPDGYQFFLEDIGPLSNINKKYYLNRIAFWNDFISHPNYDEFWQSRNILPHLDRITPAVMTVGGWYDAEDLYGPLKTYQSIEAKNPEAKNIIVMGPWKHGGYARGDGATLGNIFFKNDPPPSYYYLENIEYNFFNYHLKGKGELSLPEALMFDTGSNQWQRFDNWPPMDMESRTLYFRDNGLLDFEPPSATESYSEFISDPANPVPYTETVTSGMTKEYMTDDQRFAARRPDVLTFQAEILEDDITLVGNIVAELKVTTSGTAADWIIKLIDVYPDSASNYSHNPENIKMAGYQRMIRSEVFRGRFRNSYEVPEPFVPNEITEVKFELQDILHTFKTGHRIMIQVQSSWFPLVDRNPQKYVDNIYFAEKSDFVTETHRIYHTAVNPSIIEVRIITPD